VVGAYYKTVRCDCRVIGINLFPAEVAGFIIGCTSLCVNYSEVGINSDWFWHFAEHLLEIGQGGAGGKSHLHHFALAVCQLGGITAVVVIGS